MVTVTRLTHATLGFLAWIECAFSMKALGGALTRHDLLAVAGHAPATLVLASVGLWLTETLWLKPDRPAPQPAAKR
jgi:hypothetical protein